MSDFSDFDNDEELEELDAGGNSRSRILRLGIIGAIVIGLICVVGILVYQILFTDVETVAQATATPSTAADTPADATDEPAAGDESATATPTRVISEDEAATEPTATPTVETDVEPTATPAPTSTATATTTTASAPTNSSTTQTIVTKGPNKNAIENGGFEDGFTDAGVGIGWQPFKNDQILALYGPESADVYIHQGDSAQRMVMTGATTGDRYAGILQQIPVLDNEEYVLRIRGQIRTSFGDVEASSFGYRLQYALVQRAMTNFQMVPDDAWIELPIDEQLIDAADAEFTEFIADPITAESDTVTLFIRGWNKWPDQSEAQYTIDSVSLTGPSLVEQTVTVEDSGSSSSTVTEAASDSTTEDEGEAPMVDQALPVTGLEVGASLFDDGRFWGGVVVLVLLVVGTGIRAIWRR